VAQETLMDQDGQKQEKEKHEKPEGRKESREAKIGNKRNQSIMKERPKKPNKGRALT
jgi:hypothetical protein